MQPNDKILEVAKGYLGTHEQGGNNHGDQVEAFLHNVGANAGDSWCAAFVSTCLLKAWAFLHALPATRETLPTYRHAVAVNWITTSAACEAIRQSAKDQGNYVKPGVAKVLAGSILFYDFHGVGVAHHIGILREDYHVGDITVHTIEGNTSDESAADGDAVAKKDRPITHVMGFATYKAKP